jgi:hypothetical protein
MGCADPERHVRIGRGASDLGIGQPGKHGTATSKEDEILCINNYTQEYIDDCRAKLDRQVAAYRKLVKTARSHDGAKDGPLGAAIASFEPVFFNNMALVLEGFFVQRSRTIEKKDGNPLNEVRVLCNSMIEGGGIMCAEKSIKLDPAKSVLGYDVGEEIHLREADFARIVDAFLAEVEQKFLPTGG